jgi:lysophospholipase L1-like esterase
VASIGSNDCCKSSSEEIINNTIKAIEVLKTVADRVHLLKIPPKLMTKIKDANELKKRNIWIRTCVEVNAAFDNLAEEGVIVSVIDFSLDPQKPSQYATHQNGTQDETHANEDTYNSKIVPAIVEALIK